MPFTGAMISIATPGYGLDENRVFCRLTQGVPKPLHGSIQAVFEIHKRIRSPQPLPHLLPRYQFARALQKHFQHSEGLTLKLDRNPTAAQFTAKEVNFEAAKANYSEMSVITQQTNPRRDSVASIEPI